MCIVIKYLEINAVPTLFVFPVHYDLRIPVFFSSLGALQTSRPQTDYEF